MANPQVENGYLRIATEIFEALCGIRIPGETRQVIDVVIRKTYGYNKKEDCISLSQFCLLTGMRRGGVCRAINKAVSMNILKVISKEANGKGNKYCIVKDFDSWKSLAKKRRGVSNKLIIISKKENLGVSKKRHTIDSIKDNKDITPQSGEHLKKKKMNKYNESKSSDSYEKEIDLDTQEEITEPKSNASEAMKSLLKWSEKRRGAKFINVPKQYKAFAVMRGADISPARAKERWQDMEEDKYWSVNGFDWSNVVVSFDKKP